MDSTTASDRITEGPVHRACEVHLRKSPATAAQQFSCHLCHAPLGFSATSHVQDQTRHVVTPSLPIHAMKTMYLARLVHSSSRRNACVVLAPSKTFDVVKLLFLVARLAEDFYRVAIINVGRCVIYLEIVRIVHRLVESQSQSVVIHARRNGELRNLIAVYLGAISDIALTQSRTFKVLSR